MNILKNIIVILMFLIANVSTATNYYVNKNATGNNTGTSWTNAWKTFSTINWNLIQPGDFLYISGGTDSLTYTENLSPKCSGTAIQRIKILPGKYSPFPSGHSGKVKLTGGITFDEFNGTNEPKYITVQGFDISGKGVNFDIDYPTAKGNIFDSCYIHDLNDNTFGFRIIGYIDSLIIRNSVIIDCSNLNCAGQTDCIHINSDGAKIPRLIIIHDNFIRAMSQDPVAHNDALQSVHCDGLIIFNNIIINDSVYSPEGGGIPLIISSNDDDQNDSPPVLVFNNLVYMGGVWYPGANYSRVLYTRHDGGGTFATQSPTYVFNNTFVSNGPRTAVTQQEYHIDLYANNILASYCLPDGVLGTNWRTGSEHGWHVNLNGNDAYGSHLYRDSTKNNLYWRQDNNQNIFSGSFYTIYPATFSPSNWNSWISGNGTGVNSNPNFVTPYGEVSNQGSILPDILLTSPAVNAGINLTYMYNFILNTYGLDYPQILKDIYGTLRDANWDIGAFEHPDAMPVELVSFSISKIEFNTIMLMWETAIEVNNYGFDIERSTDNLNFNKIGFVRGNGNSNSPKYYSYLDTLENSGRYYYRLKQIDIDGIFEYSDVIVYDVIFPMNFSIKSYPNPFNSQINLILTSNIQYVIDIYLYNILGEKVFDIATDYKMNNFDNILINMDNFTSGIYYITIIDKNNILGTQKVVLLK